jgi:FAD/FMN-containing dehydrogenase
MKPDARQQLRAVPEEVLLRRLGSELPGLELTTEPATRRMFSADLLCEGACCAAIVHPSSLAELQAAVSVVAAAGYGIVPRGGGLTYVGGYTPSSAETVLFDLRKLNRIICVSEENLTVTVEAGVTWEQLGQALARRGLRLPFLGTFSGRHATVGGGLGNGALFFGSARYGGVAENVLGLQVVTAAGDCIGLGSQASKNGGASAYPAFGPGLAGLFLHDAGALGIKATATLLVMRATPEHCYLSFGFEDAKRALALQSAIAREELAEDLYLMDPRKTDALLELPAPARALTALRGLASDEGNWLRAAVLAGRILLNAPRLRGAGLHGLHLVLSGRDKVTVRCQARRVRDLAAAAGAKPLPALIPRSARETLFPPLEALLGPAGERWVALNAKVPHDQAATLYAAADAVIKRHERAMQASGVSVSLLVTALTPHWLSYEPVLHWSDSWLPLHRSAPQVQAGAVSEPPANEAGRAAAMALRADLLDCFSELGAAHTQLGRTYPLLPALEPATAALLLSLKKTLDPGGVMNPGALGMPV